MKNPFKLSLLALAITQPAWAEDIPLYSGDDIVVTATRFKDKALGRPVNLTVISQEELSQTPEKTLPEILANQVGISTRDFFGNNASSATVDMRGFGAAAGQNTLILLDGKRLTDIDLSGVLWSAIPLASIERIEILRGGASVLYGSGATAGVINIITKSPIRTGNTAHVALSAGSYNTREIQVNGNYANKQFGLNLTADHYTSDGYRQNNRNQQDNFQGDARWNLERGEYSLKFGADSQDQRLPGARRVQPSIGLNELETDRRGAQTPFDYASRDGHYASFGTAHRINRVEISSELSYRDKNQKAYYDFGGFPSYSNTDLKMLAFTPRVKISFGPAGKETTLITGIDAYHWDYKLRTSDAPANIGLPIHRVNAKQDSAAIYLQSHTQLSKPTALSLGLRSDVFKIDAQDSYDATAPGGAFDSGALAGSQREHELAYELGLRHQLDETTSVFGKAGRSYRFATVDEIYEYSPAFAREFQFLRPQTSLDQELGVEWRQSKNRLRASLYHFNVKDEIHLDPYMAGTGNTNLPPLRRYGVELEGKWSFNQLTLFTNYTFAQAKFTAGTMNGVNLDGKQVPLVAKYKVNVNLSWDFSQNTQLNTVISYVSKQYMDNDEPNTLGLQIPAYTTIDAKLAHTLGAWKFSAAVNNLLNKKYYNYAVRSTFVSDRYAAYPLPERNITVTAEYTFK